MVPPPPPSPVGRSRKAIFLIALFVVPVIFVAITLLILGLHFRLGGKRVAEVELVAPQPTSASLDVAAGDRLLFEVDFLFDAPSVSGTSKQKIRMADATMAGALRASTVTIQTSVGGRARTTTCPAYNGMSFSTTLSEDGT